LRIKPENIAEVLKVEAANATPDPYSRVLSGKLIVRAPCLRGLDMKGLKSRFDCTLDGGTKSNGKEVFCVQILSFPSKSWFSSLRRQHQAGEINAIIIEAVRGTDEQYRRIGIARIPMAPQGSDWKSRQSLLSEARKTLSPPALPSFPPAPS
jgi:hypothetical protein